MAYKGKFSQPRNTEEALRLKELARKNAQTDTEKPVQPTASSAPKAAPKAQPNTGNAPAAAREVPAKPGKTGQQNVKTGKKRKTKKGNRNITIIFYTFYFCLIAAFVGGMFFLNNWVDGFLINFQNSQPTTKCDEIFAEYFESPDWKELYHIAGLQDTAYEGADSYNTFMTEKVGQKKLSYVETSAGLSGGRKYLLKLDSETLGYFTLKDLAPQGSELSDWQLDTISLNTVYAKSVRVQTEKGHKVSINGVALEDDHIIQISTTLAGNYLPEGVRGPTTCIYQLDGLMAEPQVTVTDAEGNVGTVTYDQDAGMYIEQTETNTIGDAEHDAAMEAGKTYAKYMIEEASYTQLAKYYDAGSQIFKTITSMQLWMQGHNGYEFANEQVTDYCRYSDKYFSARVSLSLNVTRRDNTVKEYTVDTTLFFRNNGKKWIVYDMTNVDVQAPIAEVRLTFKLEENVVFTNMFENDISSLKLPTVSAPEGQVFSGWFQVEMDETGAKHYVRVFPPAEDDTITLPAGTILEPMTLYALFEPAN